MRLIQILYLLTGSRKFDMATAKLEVHIFQIDDQMKTKCYVNIHIFWI